MRYQTPYQSAKDKAIFRSHWTTTVVIVLIYSASFAMLWAGLHTPQSQSLAVGDYRDWDVLRGWHSPQQCAGAMVRWSSGQSTIYVNEFGGGRAAVQLRMGLPEGSTTSTPIMITTSTGKPLPISIEPSFRLYHLLLPLPTNGSNLHLAFDTQRFSLQTEPPSHNATIGLTNIRWKAPLTWFVPWYQLLHAAGATIIITLLTFRISQTFHWSWFITPLIIAAIALFAMVDRPLALLILAWLPWYAAAITALFFLLAWRIGQSLALRWLPLIIIIVVAALLRFWNLNWDDTFLFHFNEKLFTKAAFDLKPPWNPHFFAYGSLMIYLTRATAELLVALGNPYWLETQGQFSLIGRFYSAMFSTTTVLVVALVGWRWFSYRVGLWAAIFLGGTVLAIQNGHFGTTDSLLTLQLVLLTFVCLRYIHTGSWRMILVVGIILGIGVATKMPALSFAVWPTSAMLISIVAKSESTRTKLRILVQHSIILVGSALLACFICAPYYFLAWQDLISQMNIEAADATKGEVSYTYQFIGTTRFLYQFYNALFTIGPTLLVLGLSGWIFLLVRVFRKRQLFDMFLMIGPTFYFLAIGSAYTKFFHYVLPVLPFLCLYAGLLLESLRQQGGWLRRASWLIGSATAIATLGYGFIFTYHVYGKPDPRLVASAWIYRHVPWGSTIVRDGETLPVSLMEPNNPLAIKFRRNLFHTKNLLIYWNEKNHRPEYYLDALSQGDYLILEDRIELTFRRLPELFPVPACFYQQLAAGKFGYTPIKNFSRGPTLGDWRIDDPFDPMIESSFQIFDHPMVQIYARTRKIERAEMEQAFRECL